MAMRIQVIQVAQGSQAARVKNAENDFFPIFLHPFATEARSLRVMLGMRTQ